MKAACIAKPIEFFIKNLRRFLSTFADAFPLSKALKLSIFIRIQNRYIPCKSALNVLSQLFLKTKEKMEKNQHAYDR